jgi:glycosyltransferase (activator-dependent family)
MRILFTTHPEKTLFLSMVPLAWALRTAGHEVRVASQPAFADTITQAGLTAVPVGRQVAADRLLLAQGVTAELIEENRPGLPEPYNIVEDPDGADWDETLYAFADAVDGVKFETFAITTSLVNFARHWQPDLIIWDPLTHAGPIAAKACGAAHARLLFGIDVFGLSREHFLCLRARQAPEDRGDPLADWLGGYARKYGAEFTEDMTTGHFTIDQIPRSLQVEADLDYLRARYVPYGGAAVIPPWLQAPAERPRIALTLGTTATEHYAGYTIPLSDVLDSLSDLDVEVVATVAESEQRKLTHVPDNARIVSYVPLHALAPTCSAAIHHAGFGTLNTFAQHAIPQLTIPFHFDEPILGRKLAGQGAGLEIDPSQATGDNVRDSVWRLLNESTFRQGAEGLRDEMLALPTPNQLVGEIEELITKYRAS